MAAPNDNISMALYCDFENVALGVRDAKYDKFNIRPVLERLLLKGSIVVKKAYCDWDRYKEFKPQMHEASFELIEIPHLRMSGKNSADIRLVVDALDLCYTKSHVNTFVIISGDSDFSPLVSKLRENAKYVIGVGVKDSTSDLLVANCDEFIFIDDLVRESRRAAASRETRQSPSAARRPAPADDADKPKESLEVRKNRAVDLASETFEALMAERGDGGKIWASALKQAIKRRKPDFNEVYFGFRTFGNLLEEAQARGMLEIGRDDKSGSYVYRSSRALAAEAAGAAPPTGLEPDAEAAEASGRGRRSERGKRNRPMRDDSGEAALATTAAEPAWDGAGAAPEEASAEAGEISAMPVGPLASDAGEEPIAPLAPVEASAEPAREKGRRRGARKAAARAQQAPEMPAEQVEPAAALPAAAAPPEAASAPEAPAEPERAQEIDLPISNAQRRAMRNSSRMPARARKAAQSTPAPADASTDEPALTQNETGGSRKTPAASEAEAHAEAAGATPPVQDEAGGTTQEGQASATPKRSRRQPARSRKPKADAAVE